MKISVVIPAYNADSTIDAAIRSCLQQTLTPYEIIVVDDASTDSTRNIAMQYPEVYVLTQNQNAGPSAARNRGRQEATGDIIAFLDSDDTWHPAKLEVIHNVFSEHDHISYIGHPYSLQQQEVDTENIRISRVEYFQLITKNVYQPSCIAVRKGFSELFNESYRYCEDYELSLRVAYKDNAYWLDMPLTILGRPQLSSGGASASLWKMRLGELRLYTSVYKQNLLYLPLVPLLWIFSLGKMLRRLMK